MNLPRICLKVTLLTVLTILLAPFYFVILLVFYRWRQIFGPRLIQVYSRFCLSIFRVRIEVKNRGAFARRRGGMLIIANHTCLLDIFVLSSLFRAVFVSKKEVKYYPIVGQIAWLAGVVFFDRSAARERTRVVRTIAYDYWDRTIAIFPQGTTGSITDRIPFNRGIFKVAELNHDISLLPVTLRYERDSDVSWSKPQTLTENALKVSAQKEIKLEVLVHEPVTIGDYRGKSTVQICRMTEQTVLEPLQKPWRKR